MLTLLHDLRLAIRSLSRQAVFSLSVVAVLGLAVGMGTAIFSLVEETLLRPLPFRTPARLVLLQGVAGPERAVRGASVPEVQDWGRTSRTLEAVAMYDETTLALTTPGGAERIEAEMVSASYFGMMGGRAQLGRTFTADEDRIPDANPVVVLSDAIWRTRFAGDPKVLGRTITLNERAFTVLGVMEPSFRGLSFDTDLWFPSMMMRANGGPADLSDRGQRWLTALGRLRDGVSPERAQRDLDRVARQLATDFPETNADRGVQLVPLREAYLGSTRGIVVALFGAVGLLLLIACANVMGLQLVRATGRGREIALRTALGAAQGRLARQFVAEGLVLAGTAVLVGVVVAHAGLGALTALVPAGVLPPYARPRLDGAALAFALAVGGTCGVLIGLVPALRAPRLALMTSLKDGARGSAAAFQPGRRLGGQQALVVGQTAVALVLLVGAGLFIRTLQRELAVAPGFEAAGVLRARAVLPDRYSPDGRRLVVEQLRNRLLALPGVRGVALGSDLPFSGATSAAFLYIPETAQRLRYYRHSVSPDYFATLGIPVTRGRPFGAADRADAPRVVMISASAARRIWGDADPVGRALRFGDAAGPSVTVVGVVGDVRFRDLTTSLGSSEPDVYVPLSQRPVADLELAVRSALPPAALSAAVRRAVVAVDPQIPLFEVQPMDELLEAQTARSRLASAVLGAFGLAALVLAAVGLYGVLAFLVSTRRREIGIRIALGASRTHVIRGIVKQGLGLVSVGLLAGGVIALWAVRAVESQLFGISVYDPWVFTAVVALLLSAALAASGIPARRAARTDPQLALRTE